MTAETGRAEIEAVYIEARDDLDRLIAAGREIVAAIGTSRGAVEITGGLLAQPSWTRIMLASVVGAAVARICAEGDTTP